MFDIRTERLRLRQVTLAHVLGWAQVDAVSARAGAIAYQDGKEYAGMFDGLVARFDTERSRARADARKGAQ